MNKTRAPTDEEIREQVEKDYLQGLKPKALSEKYGISVNTIKSWQKRYRWGREKENEGAPSRQQGAPSDGAGAPSKKKAGAPRGNKNAAGAGVPSRNKNAEKHGAYSRIYWDSLSEDELELMQDIPSGEEFHLKQEIAMCTIRERRLMHDIEKFRKNAQKGLYVKGVKKKKRVVFDEDGKKVDAFEDTNTDTEYEFKGLAVLEAELTKVQRAKMKTIDSLIRLRAVNERYDDLLNGWKTKAEAQEEMEGDAEEVTFYLPENGRDQL